ncbi:UPF0182 family protein [Brachybacterium sp. EF45031]|nr:UPF0182 family protein [Brachybacterium sillae]
MITVGVLGALLILLLLAAEYGTTYLWFQQLGYTSVLWTRWIARAVLFTVGFVLFALPLWLSMRWCYRARPVYAPVTREQEAIDQFRRAIDPLRRTLTLLAPLVIGAFAGLALASRWQEALLFLHPQSFGTEDPVFGRDVGFYVFTVPFIDIILAVLQFLLVVLILASLVGHFLFGGLQWTQEEGLLLTRAARRHLGLLAVLYLIRQAVALWFERYTVLTGSHGRFDGASYTDVNAIVPAKTILAIAALLVALLVLAWMIRGDLRLPLVGVGALVLASLAVGVAYPWFVQKVRVDPSELAMEQPYIAENIAATRTAFDVDDVRVVQYAAATDAEAGALRADAETTAQIRLLDPAVVAPTFNQREANRRYWGFEDVLSVDRYEIDGSLQDTVIGVRELRPDTFELETQPWVNQHMIYTHGYGVVAAYGNRRAANGEPAYFQSGVPGQGALGTFEERVYFGRHSPDYSIVGAPEGANPLEFDYQSTTGQDSGADAQQYNTFTGDGGPSIGNPLNRLLYAVKFRDINILISSYVNEESQILYDRDPQDRVRAVAPFLELDSAVQPAVVDGRLVWVIDGYTATDRYPYSRTLDMRQTATDSVTSSQELGFRGTGRVNYLRNGVKATVDAFDGSVTLYAWDTEDPILRAWQETFPQALRPAQEIDGALMSHLRYPQDMFKAQREILGRYHVTDPDEFFGQQDFWQVSEDPTQQAAAAQDGQQTPQPAQPPYYLTMQMPGQDTPRFSLSTSYIPARGQQVLTGMLVADSETGNASGNPADTYGDLTLLVLPSTNPVPGPRQVQASFNAEPNVSRALNLLKSGNSEVLNGNLLTVPVGGGLLYVQPVYLQSSTSGGGTQYPLLQLVLVSFGNRIGFAPTLDEALDQVFGGDSGANAGDASVPATGTAGSADTEDGTTAAASDPDQQAAPPAAAAGDAQARLDQALAEMETATREAEQALQAGDWEAYGAAQDTLQQALRDALAANAELGGTAPSDAGGASDAGGQGG